MEQPSFHGKFHQNARTQHEPLRFLLARNTMHWCRSHILKLTFKMWCGQSWTEEAQNYRARYRNVSLQPWAIIATELPVYKGLRVSYCFKGVLQLALTCKELRILCLQNFRRWWIQIRQATRNTANLEYTERVPFPMVVKLSATVSRGERRAGSSGVDTTNRHSATESTSTM